MSLFEELKRRNVIRVVIAYAVAAWLLLQITDIVTPILEWSDSIPRMVLFLLVIGFIPAVILAWAFEWTPEGVKLDSEVDRSKSITGKTGRKLDRVIIVVLTLAISFLLVDKFVLRDSAETAIPGHTVNISESDSTRAVSNAPGVVPGNTNADPGSHNSVAVLPFVAMSNGPDDDYFSDGLTEEIINALAQLPELLVTARTSAFHFKGQNIPVAEIAGQLGVDNIVEGSVRRAGEQLRITAQLIRASDGFHLWSETYDRRTEDTLAVQADIAEKVASALNIVLDFKQRARMQRAGVHNVEAYTAYQKSRRFFENAHGNGPLFSMLRQGNHHLDQAIVLAPNFYKAYIQHSDLYVHILMSQANGELDGDISEQDIQQAPSALQTNYEHAIRSAKNYESRIAAEFDMAFALGEWRGLSSRSIRTLQAPGCTPALWAQLGSGAFGLAELLLESFSGLSVCDPVSLRPWVHMIYANMWLGQPASVIELVESRLATENHRMVPPAYAIALAATGRVEQAEQSINDAPQSEDIRLFARAMLASQTGNADTSSAIQNEYLSKYGPNDYNSLMMEAARGSRNEANRLAGLIDRRPFGYLALMQAIYYCFCGAPFDLEATPVFASMLSESGLPWPPAKPIDFPLKDW